MHARIRTLLVALAAVPAGAMAQAKPAPADVAFMQGMIHHHAQALEMVALLNKNSTAPGMKSLGERIDVSQKDEIKMMQDWLREHHETIPAPMPTAHAGMPGMHATMMPGMLTAAQMAELGAATGKAFDRLFLTGMIQHHEGAITMVKELFATSGAANRTDIYRFASDVDADQRAEITRMRAMLDAIRDR